MKHSLSSTKGFTLIEITLVIAIISIISGIAYSSFSGARAESRDKVRVASLQQLQLALELYKDKNGRYPVAGCGRGTGWVGPGTHPVAWGNAADCPMYIVGLAPEFMPALPRDPKDEMVDGVGFLYKTDTNGTTYKVLVNWAVEANLVTSYNNELARCPRDFDLSFCDNVPQNNSYAIYSAGAENW